MLPNLANHSVKGFEGGKKVGLKLAHTKSAEVENSIFYLGP
jgi:hypothetical protein